MKSEVMKSGNVKTLNIPAVIRIGVTGHRTLNNEMILNQSVKKVLSLIDEILNKNLRHTRYVFSVISPLAEGSDRLVAGAVIDLMVSRGIEEAVLDVVLPLSAEDYMKDFKTEESKNEFKAFITKAKSVIALENAAFREAAYENVGHYVVDNCDFLIAIWNGKPASGKGGTAEIMEYSRNLGKHIFWINSENGKITEERNDR